MKLDSTARKNLLSFPLEVQNYFSALDKSLNENNYKLVLGGGKAVNCQARVGGYFCPFSRKIAVATGSGWRKALDIAIHESNHWKQSLDEKSPWCSEEINAAHSEFSYWLQGEPCKNPKRAMLGTFLIERDCEKRSVKEITQKWSHLVDIPHYIKCANAYLAAHEWMLQNRKWPQKSTSQNKIIAHCPDNYLFKNLSEVPKDLKMALDRWL